MKKVLLFICCIYSSIIFAQTFNQPSQFNWVCDDNNDGFAAFYLDEISYEILGNLNSNDYVITHHETLTEAQTGANPLSSPYFNITLNQTLYARVVTVSSNAVQVITYQLNVLWAPPVPDQVVTNCSNNFQCWNLIVDAPPGAFNTYFETMADAQANMNQIADPSCYVSSIAAPAQPSVYYRATDTQTGCSSIGIIELVTTDCQNPNCPAPTGLSISSPTSDSVLLDWTASAGAQLYVVMYSVNGGAYQTITTQVSNVTIPNLLCGATYTFVVTANCGNSGSSSNSEWITFITPTCSPQPGQPVNLSQCESNGQACFNLEINTPNILGTLNPADYTVTYYTSQAAAETGLAPIINATVYCTAASNQIIYARLENNTNQEYQVFPFALVIDTVEPNTITLSNMDQCDDNNDSVVTFDLTTIQAQINSSNTLEYYTALSNAQYQIVPITNASSFTVGVQSPITSIFVREIVPNSCDIIYTFQARAFAVCNLAFVCDQANSLCNALGVPFANTSQNIPAEVGNSYGCLFSQPNPTWFYLPVSNNGTINLMIEQNSSIAFNGIQQDVDFIVYGPFTNPVTPCSGQLTDSTIVSCSYSAAAIEYPTITGALAGQYYIIMVTNYSNQSGFIRITELSSSVGAIDCSGLRLNAFLDSNNNGSQDIGEQNFPLGQFTYEINDNGNVHNIISPSGVYNIYDGNVSNSYDLTYAIDPNYAALYNLSTSSYSNVSVINGGGMLLYNFPITVVQSYNDLAVNIVPVNAPRPGFTYENKIIYTNNGNQTIASGTVTFTKDALVTITGNTQTGTTPTANGFTYNFTNLLPFETRTMTVAMQVPTIPTVTIGGLLTNSASIAPLAGDVVPGNNSASNTQIIIGSYDPNDKMESHGEQILYSSFTSNDYLHYTIRFENTGSASAINVKVFDVLDDKLDETSIKMISASTIYTMDRVNNNLAWSFDNIQLPPSIANSNTGKGYISFKVKPKAGYAIGDIIPNTASIYFDYNPAIITNTFNTQFVAQLAVGEFDNGDFVCYPNPVTDVLTISLKDHGTISSVVLYDVLGKIILVQKPTSQADTQSLDLSLVAKGMYLLEVTNDSNQKALKKVVVD